MGNDDGRIGPDTEFRQMAAAVLTERLDTLFKHEEGTRVGADPEELHDMRVASRRLRAALDAFAVCYHGKEFERVARQTKEMTDALGSVRDSDVLLERMEAYAQTVPPDERPAIVRFIGRIQEEREGRRTAMLHALNELANSGYAERSYAVLAHPGK